MEKDKVDKERIIKQYSVSKKLMWFVDINPQIIHNIMINFMDNTPNNMYNRIEFSYNYNVNKDAIFNNILESVKKLCDADLNTLISL